MAFLLAYDSESPKLAQSDRRREIVSSFAEARSDRIDWHFLAVPLSDLRVVQGALRNDTIFSTDDLLPGDEFAAPEGAQAFVANAAVRRDAAALCKGAHADLIADLGGADRKQRLLFIASNGATVEAYAITPRAGSARAPYLLLPRLLDTRQGLCLVEISEFRAAPTRPAA